MEGNFNQDNARTIMMAPFFMQIKKRISGPFHQLAGAASLKALPLKFFMALQ